MTIEHHVTHRLSDYLDGELDAAGRAEVEAHLAVCAGCRDTLRELRQVVTRAAALPDSLPDRDLWPGVMTRIEPRHGFGGRLKPFRQAAARRVSFTLPQLAAAGIALMLLSGGLVWMARTGDTRADFPPLSADSISPGEPRVSVADFSDSEFDEAVADLEQILSEGRTTLDPETVRVIEDNLRAIDQAIDQSRRALVADPANTYLNSHLARARQRKLALLRRASGLAAAGS